MGFLVCQSSEGREMDQKHLKVDSVFFFSPGRGWDFADSGFYFRLSDGPSVYKQTLQWDY